ncbi:MAG: hypothetical protein QM522_04370 [Chitinophagaceae bacterium]|nr:hypothetical protein [Chitinophagaceae bacterium]
MRLPEGLERRLGEEARHCGQPRSELIHEALEELLRHREQERFMAGLVTAAEALASDTSARAESLDVAADFLPADSEALALAEVDKLRQVVILQANPITQAGLATVIVVPLTTQGRLGARETWTPKTEPALMRASPSARLGQDKPHETQAPHSRAEHSQAAHR